MVFGSLCVRLQIFVRFADLFVRVADFCEFRSLCVRFAVNNKPMKYSQHPATLPPSAIFLLNWVDWYIGAIICIIPIDLSIYQAGQATVCGGVTVNVG